MPQRAFLNIFCDDLTSSKTFYTELFDFRVSFDSDWFVHLQSSQNGALELGLILRTHAIAHEEYRRRVGGMLTLVIEDVDALVLRAKESGCTIIEEPRDMFYGQRRALLLDPNDMLLDVSSECDPDPEWLATL